MEGDWAVEVGADLPAIVVPWEGFVELRHDPSLASGLPETAASPALEQALVRLNQSLSPVFTSKCDAWPLSGNEIDPLEFDAAREDAKHGIASYIDIIARRASLFMSFPAHEIWIRSAIDEVRQTQLRQARADLVVRMASVEGREGFAITLYVAACGATVNAAEHTFLIALETAATITMKHAANNGRVAQLDRAPAF